MAPKPTPTQASKTATKSRGTRPAKTPVATPANPRPAQSSNPPPVQSSKSKLLAMEEEKMREEEEQRLAVQKKREEAMRLIAEEEKKEQEDWAAKQAKLAQLKAQAAEEEARLAAEAEEEARRRAHDLEKEEAMEAESATGKKKKAAGGKGKAKEDPSADVVVPGWHCVECHRQGDDVIAECEITQDIVDFVNEYRKAVENHLAAPKPRRRKACALCRRNKSRCQPYGCEDVTFADPKSSDMSPEQLAELAGMVAKLLSAEENRDMSREFRKGFRNMAKVLTAKNGVKMAAKLYPRQDSDSESESESEEEEEEEEEGEGEGDGDNQGDDEGNTPPVSPKTDDFPMNDPPGFLPLPIMDIDPPVVQYHANAAKRDTALKRKTPPPRRPSDSPNDQPSPVAPLPKRSRSGGGNQSGAASPPTSTRPGSPVS